MLRKYHFNDDNLNEAKAINLIQLLNVMFHAPPRPPHHQHKSWIVYPLKHLILHYQDKYFQHFKMTDGSYALYRRFFVVAQNLLSYRGRCWLLQCLLVSWFFSIILNLSIPFISQVFSLSDWCLYVLSNFV